MNLFGRNRRGGRGNAGIPPVSGFENITFRDLDQRNNFEQLSRTDLVPTRFLSTPTMARFGMEDALRILFNGTGLGAFYGMLEYTYKDLTLEFLSAFVYSKNANTVSFRLGGQEFSFSVNDFAAIFGIPPPSENELDFYMEDVWFCITGTNDETYDVSKLQLSKIQDPRIKIWVRTLTSTLFGRDNSDRANKNELNILGCYLNIDGDDDLIVYDIPSYFAAHLARLANGKLLKHICIGGLVTFLAKRLIDFTGEGYSQPMTTLIPVIDAEYLANSARWIVGVGTNKYQWVVTRQHRIRIPMDYLPLIERRAPRRPDQSIEDRPSFLIPMGVDQADAAGPSFQQHVGGSSIPPPVAQSSSSSQFSQAYCDGFNPNTFQEQRHNYEMVTQNLMHYHQYNYFLDQGSIRDNDLPPPAFWTGRDNYPGNVFNEYGMDPSVYNSSFHATFGGAGGQFLPPPVEVAAPPRRRGGREGRGGRVRQRPNTDDEDLDG